MEMKKNRCEKCGGDNFLPIIYGLTAGIMDGVILGGCMYNADSPTMGCSDCWKRITRTSLFDYWETQDMEEEFSGVWE